MKAAGLARGDPRRGLGHRVERQLPGGGRSAASLKYLAPYVFKVAIANSRIVHFDDAQVVFRYRKVHSNRVRTMRLAIFEFMHRFLQHVLPTGFMKVRYYGFVSPSFAMPLEELKARVEMAQGFAAAAASPGSDRTTPADVLPALRGPATL